MSYAAFLDRKAQIGTRDGFAPTFLPSFLFDFQAALVEWAVQQGRAAIFADCGTGKGPMALVWAENVVRHTNGRVLVLAPLAVSQQFVHEGEKFGIGIRRSLDGTAHPGITVTNYERLHHFRAADFVGCVCDESGILKNFDGVLRGAITDFMRKMRYRLLCSATPAPNDFIELGSSSEALGFLGYTDMLGRFFKNDQNTVKPMRYTGFGNPRGRPPGGEHTDKWRLKGHAEIPFWRWVCSWARAIRKPSDLGFADDAFVLPPLVEREHMVGTTSLPEGMLFALPAVGLKEQRDERRRTITERCEKVAALASHDRPVLVFCHLNPEGDLLERLIPGAVQVSGRDSDDAKEEKLLAFARGDVRALVTKPRIGAHGLNLQHCAHITFFPSHSFEQYYQGVRRCWRFGQTRPVVVDVVTTEGEKDVLSNLQRKARAADVMFSRLVALMNEQLHVERNDNFNQAETVPSWL